MESSRQIGSSISITAVLGDLMRFEVVGTTLTVYYNGTQIFQTTDSALSTGSPGIALYQTSAPTAFTKSWEGGNLIWTRQGTVIAKTIGNGGGAQEPSVLYDTNPQILSANPDGKIFKMWYTNGWTNPVVINYAESSDGITWTQYSSNPVINNGADNSLHGFVFRSRSTYYAYIGNDLGANNGTTVQFDLWQSSNGVSWSLTNAAVLTTGAISTWDNLEIANPVVWVQGSIWYMLYSARAGANSYSTGLATSPDGVVWTKYISNPVITNLPAQAANGKNVILAGGLYYLWGATTPSSTLPTDISLWSSPDLHTWTPATNNPIYERVLVDEGVNMAVGQVSDPSLVEVNGTTYLYYDATPAQSAGNIHINAATVPYTMIQLLQVIFGVTISSANSSWLTTALASSLRGLRK